MSRKWKFAALVCVVGLFGLSIGYRASTSVNDAVSLQQYIMSVYIVGYVLGMIVVLMLFSVAEKWGMPLMDS